MDIRSVALVAVVALASASTGYWLGQPVAPSSRDAARHAASPIGEGSTTSAHAAPVIAVAHDGTVTLHVDQQPLEWVLEQIALQSGWGDSKARASAPSTAGASAVEADASCPQPVRVSLVEPATLLQQIQRGSETQRAQGFLDARSAGVVVPDDIAKTMFETDASDRVRLFAFETYLEARADDNAAMRRALEAALLVPNAVIQREAKARLDVMNESERIDAASKQAPDS